jgi:putative sterol carrier protein
VSRFRRAPRWLTERAGIGGAGFAARAGRLIGRVAGGPQLVVRRLSETGRMESNSSNLESYTNTIREKVGADAGLKASIKFAFTEGGALFIDGKSSPNRVSNEDAPADCTVKVSLEDFDKLMSRKLDPTTAFMMGKIKIEGDMGVAMRLGKLFG